MKKVMLIVVIMLFLSMTIPGILQAEDVKYPRVSPGATVSQTIGLTEIKITYHRPGVKERTIWGDLVPLDKVWRTGANEATTIEFGSDVMVEGQKLAAGTYGLFTIPGKDEWTFVFSKQAKIWGTYGYKEDQDVLRIKVKPAAAPHCEWMQFRFTDLTPNSGKVTLDWEKVSVGFTVEVDVEKKLLGDIEKNMGRYWVAPYYAADYAFKKEMLDKAKKWIDISVSIDAVYWNVLLKAKVLKKLAKTKKEKKEVIKLLQKAVLLVGKLRENQKQYATEAQKMLDELKGKKK